MLVPKPLSKPFPTYASLKLRHILMHFWFFLWQKNYRIHSSWSEKNSNNHLQQPTLWTEIFYSILVHKFFKTSLTGNHSGWFWDCTLETLIVSFSYYKPEKSQKTKIITKLSKLFSCFLCFYHMKSVKNLPFDFKNINFQFSTEIRLCGCACGIAYGTVNSFLSPFPSWC